MSKLAENGENHEKVSHTSVTSGEKSESHKHGNCDLQKGVFKRTDFIPNRVKVTRN